ncbi:MAG: FAD-binding protein [Planctomycetaceae bacterium]|jgi:FAD/FMN-containing dehydrogenase/Fe-S oxidoreductase|nr:FAD-binding protein [Planctomycetaceae bacterium]
MQYLTSAQSRLQDDLRGIIHGDVACDRVTVSLYATDASPFELRPRGIVCPRSTSDVVACVRYASENQMTITVRGAGSGLAGGALGNGLIIDFTRYMRYLLDVDNESGSFTVQSGASLSAVNSRLALSSRKFGATSGYVPATTFGSLFASAGAGQHWLRYGTIRDNILGLTAVLGDGTVISLQSDDLPTASETAIATPSGFVSDTDESIARRVSLARGIVYGREHQLAEDVCRILSSVSSAELNHQRSIPANRYGYCLDGVLQTRGDGVTVVDLPRLMCGSEGTLGIVTQLKLRSAKCSKHAGAVILFFGSIHAAVRAVQSILHYEPLACELIDRRHITLLREWEHRVVEIIPPETEAVLLIEADSLHPLELTDRLNDMVFSIRESGDQETGCFGGRLFLTPGELALYQTIVEKFNFVLFRMKNLRHKIPMLEDLAVPVHELPAMLTAVQKIFRNCGVVASFSGHIGNGQLNLQPIFDSEQTDAVSVIKRLVDEVYAEVIARGGTLSSEQSGGLAKSRYLALQYPALFPVFTKLKTVFDPERILNPGKVIGDGLPWTSYLRPHLKRGYNSPDASGIITENGVRTSPGSKYDDDENDELQFSTNQLELQLEWDSEPYEEISLACNGCARCRSREPNMRMCPVFRKHSDEVNAPRSKANTLRSLIEKSLPLAMLTTEMSHQIADSCIRCYSCGNECPVEVDIPRLAFRCKMAYAAAHGLTWGDIFLSNMGGMLWYLSFISCPVNWAFTNRFSRWCIEKLVQFPQERKFPTLTKMTYLSKLMWVFPSLLHPSRETTRKVVLFLDTYPNFFDTKLVEAAVKVLRRNGISVFIPKRQRDSGQMAIACGNASRAAKLARQNVTVLADAVRQGYDIVTIDSMSSFCMQKEYVYVYEHTDTELVAKHVTDLCSFLWNLHCNGELKTNFQPLKMNVGYHAPCRSIVSRESPVESPTPAELLLRMIPELNVERLEQGCCGMAGSFGMKKQNYLDSLRIGMNLFRALKNETLEVGVTECAYCKIQMEHATKKTTLHPIKLLADAYGDEEV